MSHTKHHAQADDHLAGHKSKITRAAVERMRAKPGWQQRQEAIELAERERTRRNPAPLPDDGDDASTRRALL